IGGVPRRGAASIARCRSGMLVLNDRHGPSRTCHAGLGGPGVLTLCIAILDQPRILTSDLDIRIVAWVLSRSRLRGFATVLVGRRLSGASRRGQGVPCPVYGRGGAVEARGQGRPSGSSRREAPLIGSAAP